jgi:hypothetical protein
MVALDLPEAVAAPGVLTTVAAFLGTRAMRLSQRSVVVTESL